MFSYQKHYTTLLLLVALSLMLSVIFQCTQPLIIKWLLNDVLPSKNTEHLTQAITYLIINYIIFFCAFEIRINVLSRLSARIMAKIRFKMFYALQRMKLGQAAEPYNNPTGVMATFSQHLNQVETVSLFQMWSVIADIIMALCGGALLFYFNWIIALLVIPILVLIFIMPWYFSRKTGISAGKKNNSENQILDDVQECLSMHEVIRLNLLQKSRRRIFKEKLIDSKTQNTQYNLNLGFTSISLSLGINLAMLIIASSGSILVFKDMLSVGSFVGFIILFRSFLSAIDGISSALPVLMRSAASMSVIDGLLKEKKGNKTLPINMPAFSDGISFKNVSYFYGHNEILKNINFTIQSKKSVCIVGPSGSGKSTCLKLILKELEPRSGEIFFDGIDYKKISEKNLFPQISVVMQQAKLFETTILENIRMGNLDASDEEVISAAKKAGVHDDIMRLPEDYKTRVGSKKTTLSGGQMQRVCIARALVAEPKILCLDEATSALDPFSADLIEKTLINMKGEYTIVSVTHHLKSAVNMDHIIVMDKGLIVESGHHEELIQKKGLYAQLWEKQHGFIVNSSYREISVVPSWLKHIPLFAGLDEENLEKTAKEFEMHSVKKDAIVFKKNDIGDRFYILVAGKVSILPEEQDVNIASIATLTDGDFFGEVALIYDTPRSMTVRAESYCVFLTLHYQAFRRIIRNLPDKEMKFLLEKAKDRLTKEQIKQNIQPRLLLGKDDEI